MSHIYTQKKISNSKPSLKKKVISCGIKIIIFLLLFSSKTLYASMISISATPENPIQGQPVMIQVDGKNINDVAKILFKGKSLWFFNYQSKPTALISTDLNQKTGEYTIIVKLENGEIVEKNVTLAERKKIEAVLGIPAKLGGNTPEAATNLVTNLSKENAIINSVQSSTKKYWTEKFIYPLANPIVTDSYGYLRKTGYYTIPHKGTDFRAPLGTSVIAMNRGVVRLSIQSTIYGKTIAIDHGLGVVTYYMHLSKIYVKQGELVKRGQIIGLSGATGYAESPHLHLSVKIDGVSIDPISFMDLFK